MEEENKEETKTEDLPADATHQALQAGKKGDKKGSKVLYMVIAIAVVLAVAATFFSKVLSKKTGVSVSVNEGDFSAQVGGVLPESFPKDFPAYPGAKLTSSWTAKGKDGNGASAIWETNDSLDKVSKFYKAEIEAAGYKLSTTFEQGDSATYSFEKEGVNGFVGITQDGGKTTISVTAGTK